MPETPNTYDVMPLSTWRALHCPSSTFTAFVAWLDTIEPGTDMADVWRTAPCGAFLLHLLTGGAHVTEAHFKRASKQLVSETAVASMEDFKANLAVRALAYYLDNEITRGTLDTAIDKVTLDTPEWTWAAAAMTAIAGSVTAWSDYEDRWNMVLQSAVCTTASDEAVAARQAAVIRAIVPNPWTADDVDETQGGVLSAETKEDPEAVTLLSFLDDVRKHKLTIYKNDGVHRHIRMAEPGTNNQSYEIITWPGSLCYTGDMGTFVFNRLNDMFNFFRRDHETPNRSWVNLGYWHEKLQAVDRDSGSKSFDMDKFYANIKEFACEHAGVEDVEELTQAQQDELEPLLTTSDEFEAVAAVRDFSSQWLDLTDFWENRCQTYTPRYVWACYAIVYAIDQFDAWEFASNVETPEPPDQPDSPEPRIQDEKFVPPFTFPSAGC